MVVSDDDSVVQGEHTEMRDCSRWHSVFASASPHVLGAAIALLAVCDVALAAAQSRLTVAVANTLACGLGLALGRFARRRSPIRQWCLLALVGVAMIGGAAMNWTGVPLQGAAALFVAMSLVTTLRRNRPGDGLID